MNRAGPAALPAAIAMAGGLLLSPADVPNLKTAETMASALPEEVALSPFAVHFLDVGTGDSMVIDVGDQEVIIDGGDSVRVLSEYLDRTGIVDGPIELVIVTHADSDHWKGLNRLLGFDGKNADPPRVVEFWEPGYDRSCRPLESFDKFIAKVEEMPGLTTFRRPLGATHRDSAHHGLVEEISVPGLHDVHISLLHTSDDPLASNGDCSYRINNASIVLTAELFGHRLLLTGDANGKERDESGPGTPGHIEELLLKVEEAHPGTLRSALLKVPHHGSETANTQEFIDRVDPDFVVVSASTRHHLPRSTVLDRYDDGQRVILRTDADRSFNNDHVICFQNHSGELDCNYESVLTET